MTKDDYNLGRSLCARWSDQSKSIVKRLILDDVEMAEVAREFGVKPQYVRVLKMRFEEKVKKAKLTKFLRKEKPQSNPVPENHINEIHLLHKKGYSESQIAEFLKSIGTVVDESQLAKFLGTIIE